MEKHRVCRVALQGRHESLDASANRHVKETPEEAAARLKAESKDVRQSVRWGPGCGTHCLLQQQFHCCTEALASVHESATPASLELGSITGMFVLGTG